jgi:hypothetical protein
LAEQEPRQAERPPQASGEARNGHAETAPAATSITTIIERITCIAERRAVEVRNEWTADIRFCRAQTVPIERPQ